MKKKSTEKKVEKEQMKTENNKPIFRTAYGPKIKVQLNEFGPSRTKQEFAEECQINNIMAKFQKTGIIDHLNKYEGRYDEHSGHDYNESMNIIAQANTMFEELPSSIRSEFENNPAKFLDFTNNPENADRMIEMGLARRVKRPEETIPMATATALLEAIDAQKSATGASPPEKTPNPPEGS
jgi:phage internal scaffolding protein